MGKVYHWTKGLDILIRTKPKPRFKFEISISILIGPKPSGVDCLRFIQKPIRRTQSPLNQLRYIVSQMESEATVQWASDQIQSNITSKPSRPICNIYKRKKKKIHADQICTYLDTIRQTNTVLYCQIYVNIIIFLILCCVLFGCA